MLQYFAVMYGLLALRYFAIAGIAYLVFYIFFRKKFDRYKIQKLFPARSDYVREVGFSMLTFVIFAAIAILLVFSPIRPYTRIYTEPATYGWGYFVLSIILALLIHDTYFYWTHRLMHHPKLFKLFHLTHHRSTNPSPWAAFSFNPLEVVVEGAIIFVVVFLIPIHPLAIVAFLFLMTVYNVYGHLGYEIYPNRLIRSRAGKWLNTSTNHNMHHKYFRENYGLYFRFWDEWMGTTHPKYEERVNEITTRKPAA
jgi:Delta7-sterol 5-desaturase